MKNLKLIIIVLAILAAGVIALRIVNRPDRDTDTSATPTGASDRVAGTTGPSTIAPAKPRWNLPALPAPVTEKPVAPETVDIPPDEEGGAPTRSVQVRAGQVLATVNQMPVTLGDLVPLAAGETERAMSPEEYASRLARAIDMAVTFQAARSRGVDLSAEQQEQLAAIREKQLAALKAQQDAGMKFSTVTDAQIAFEQRLTAALILQQNLLAKEGGPSPLDHAAYSEALKALVERLKANANIVVGATGDLTRLN